MNVSGAGTASAALMNAVRTASMGGDIAPSRSPSPSSRRTWPRRRRAAGGGAAAALHDVRDVVVVLVVGVGVGREPVLAVDALAPRFHDRKTLFLTDAVFAFGQSLSLAFDDHQINVVNPNSSAEIFLIRFFGAF